MEELHEAEGGNVRSLFWYYEIIKRRRKRMVHYAADVVENEMP